MGGCDAFRTGVVGELAEACYKYGLKLGLYYSQDLDWHEPHGGGYLSGHIPCAGTAWCNDWDFPDNEIPEHMPEQMELDPSQMNELEGFKPSPYGLYETAAIAWESIICSTWARMGLGGSLRRARRF